MTTRTLVREKSVVSKSRGAWAREGGAVRRYSARRVEAALLGRVRAGWVPVVPPGTARHERVTLLPRNHVLAPVARAYRAGQRWFKRAVLEAALGQPLASRLAARALAGAGFALLHVDVDHFELRAADPRAARLVNRARLGPQRRGYKVHRVLDAFLALPAKARRLRPATDDRRLEVARLLQDDWLLDGDDLLNCRPFARLCSAWTF